MHSSKSPETSRKLFPKYLKNTERKKYQRGATHQPQGWGARPTPLGAPLPHGPLVALRCPSLAIWSLSSRKKIISKLTGRNSAATRRNLGRTNLGLRRSCFAGKLPSGRGKSSPTHHQQSSHREGLNLHQHLH